MRTVKTTKNEVGHFIFYREENSMEYVCDRCLRPKITKVRVQWTDRSGVIRNICNGCYGTLLANPHEN